jgi:hypothetical protein
MGFDLFIQVQYYLCPETGKPYYYSTQGFEKKYTLPDINIPVHLRKYLKGRGSIFHAYIQEFDECDQTDTDVYSFLHGYPLWDQVKNSNWYDETWEGIWDERNHNEFRELLVYLTETYDCNFTVDWSY